jgi:Flp pilus assembly protein TadD
LLRAAQRVRPTASEVLLGIGDAYAVLGRPKDAERAYDKALQGMPRDIPVREHLAESALKAQNYARARDLIRAAIALDPNVGHLWYDLGAALEGLGDRDGALKAYREATLHPPGDPELGPALLRVGGP